MYWLVLGLKLGVLTLLAYVLLLVFIETEFSAYQVLSTLLLIVISLLLWGILRKLELLSIYARDIAAYTYNIEEKVNPSVNPYE